MQNRRKPTQNRQKLPQNRRKLPKNRPKSLQNCPKSLQNRRKSLQHHCRIFVESIKKSLYNRCVCRIVENGESVSSMRCCSSL